MSSSSTPENPHLTDIFRTAMNPTSQTADTTAEAVPKIVVTGNGNVISFGGGRIVVNERGKGERT